MFLFSFNIISFFSYNARHALVSFFLLYIYLQHIVMDRTHTGLRYGTVSTQQQLMRHILSSHVPCHLFGVFSPSGINVSPSIKRCKVKLLHDMSDWCYSQRQSIGESVPFLDLLFQE